eukprot:gene29404-36618_t
MLVGIVGMLVGIVVMLVGIVGMLVGIVVMLAGIVVMLVGIVGMLVGIVGMLVAIVGMLVAIVVMFVGIVGMLVGIVTVGTAAMGAVVIHCNSGGGGGGPLQFCYCYFLNLNVTSCMFCAGAPPSAALCSFGSLEAYDPTKPWPENLLPSEEITMETIDGSTVRVSVSDVLDAIASRVYISEVVSQDLLKLRKKVNSDFVVESKTARLNNRLRRLRERIFKMRARDRRADLTSE